MIRTHLAVASGIAVSRVTGFLRNVLLVAAIGGSSASPGGQIFDVANTLPTNFFTLIAGGLLSTVLLPHLVELIAQGARDALGGIITLTLGAGLVGTLALMAASPLVVRLYAGSWPDDWLRLGTWLALWCLPQIFFLVAFALLSQLLTALGSVRAAAWAPVLANAVGITALLVFLAVIPSGLIEPAGWTLLMVALTAGGATAGAVAQAAILLVPLRRAGFSLRPTLHVRGLGLRTMGAGAAWAFAATVASQAAFVATSTVATAAGHTLNTRGETGPSLNSLSTAYLLALAPFSVLVVSLTTTRARELVLAASDAARLRATTRRLLGLAALLMAPCSLALVVLAPWLSATIWRTPAIGQVLVCLAPSMVPFALLYVCTRALYASKRPAAAFSPQAVVAALTAVGAVAAHAWLAPAHVVPGLAAAVGVANAAGFAVAVVLLWIGPGRRSPLFSPTSVG